MSRRIFRGFTFWATFIWIQGRIKIILFLRTKHVASVWRIHSFLECMYMGHLLSSTCCSPTAHISGTQLTKIRSQPWGDIILQPKRHILNQWQCKVIRANYEYVQHPVGTCTRNSVIVWLHKEGPILIYFGSCCPKGDGALGPFCVS